MNEDFFIIASLAHLAPKNILPFVQRYPVCELRLDLLDLDANQLKQLLAEDTQFILTDHTSNFIVEILPSLTFDEIKKIKFIDIDHMLAKGTKVFIGEFARKHKIPIIWSLHNYEKFKDPIKFYEKIRQNLGPEDIIKVVCRCTNKEEQKHLLHAYSQLKTPSVIIDLGKNGKKTRLQAENFGAICMYGHPFDAKAVIQEQVSYEELYFSRELAKLSCSKEFLCSVVGKPIAHSMSPIIFNSFFEQHNFNGRYLRIALNQPSDLPSIHKILNLSFTQVTAPYKKVLAGKYPINFLQSGQNEMTWNTDIMGLRNIIRGKGIDSAVIVGCGGASEAAYIALKDEGIEQIIICARSFQRLQQWVNYPGATQIRIENLADLHSDLLVWTIPGQVAKEHEWNWQNFRWFIDANYINSLLSFIDISNEQYISGLDWLKAQAEPVLSKMRGKPYSLRRKKLDLPNSQKQALIWIIGITGAGKSQIGRELANLMKWRFCDVDDVICEQTGMSITHYVQEYGWNSFRELESKIITELSIEAQTVISTGGGAIESQENIDVIRASGWCVWLIADHDKIEDAIRKSPRPIMDRNALRRSIDKRWDDRKMQYASCSDIVVLNDYITDQAAKTIYEEYHSNK